MGCCYFLIKAVKIKAKNQ